MAAPEWRDSRRLTGPHLVLDRPGAALEVALAPERADEVIGAWERAAAELCAELDLGPVEFRVRRFQGGATLAFSAWIDRLYAACEVNEAAWRLAWARLDGEGETAVEELLPPLRALIEEECKPAVLQLETAAREHGAPFLWDDDEVSVGHGPAARCFPTEKTPDPEAVHWEGLDNVPIAMVTGTNGKSTTVRLLAAMCEQAGLVPGMSSTDWIKVGGEVIDRGDWSGPGGARAVLRHPKTEVALLETARGGMLRRGLGVDRADVIAILNVAADHLGEWGVADVHELADVKWTLSRAAHADGLAVLNAEDELVRARVNRVQAPVLWFGLNGEAEPLASHRRAGGAAAYVQDGDLVLEVEGKPRAVAHVDAIPLAMRGAAKHNVANALAAIGLAHGLGLPIDAMGRALSQFGLSPEDNPGRLAVFELGGVTAIVDFAHNPHGQRALMEMARDLKPNRQLVVLGQAGDRDDDSISELVELTWEFRPDRILIKEMQKYLRGREPGEVPAMIRSELARVGAPEEIHETVASESAALDAALEWARPGDLLLLFSHADREATLERLSQLEAEGWRPAVQA